MCKEGIRVKDGLCNPENKCQTENCDFCTVDQNDVEKCTICDTGFVIQI